MGDKSLLVWTPEQPYEIDSMLLVPSQNEQMSSISENLPYQLEPSCNFENVLRISFQIKKNSTIWKNFQKWNGDKPTNNRQQLSIGIYFYPYQARRFVQKTYLWKGIIACLLYKLFLILFYNGMGSLSLYPSLYIHDYMSV